MKKVWNGIKLRKYCSETKFHQIYSASEWFITIFWYHFCSAERLRTEFCNFFVSRNRRNSDETVVRSGVRSGVHSIMMGKSAQPTSLSNGIQIRRSLYVSIRFSKPFVLLGQGSRCSPYNVYRVIQHSTEQPAKMLTLLLSLWKTETSGLIKTGY